MLRQPATRRQLPSALRRMFAQSRLDHGCRGTQPSQPNKSQREVATGDLAIPTALADLKIPGVQLRAHREFIRAEVLVQNQLGEPGDVGACEAMDVSHRLGPAVLVLDLHSLA